MTDNSTLPDIGYEFEHVNDKAVVEMARQQIAQFEQELRNHQLNLLRINSLPDEDESKQAAIDQTYAAIETIKGAIAATRSIV